MTKKEDIKKVLSAVYHINVTGKGATQGDVTSYLKSKGIFSLNELKKTLKTAVNGKFLVIINKRFYLPECDDEDSEVLELRRRKRSVKRRGRSLKGFLSARRRRRKGRRNMSILSARRRRRGSRRKGRRHNTEDLVVTLARRQRSRRRRRYKRRHHGRSFASVVDLLLNQLRRRRKRSHNKRRGRRHMESSETQQAANQPQHGTANPNPSGNNSLSSSQRPSQ